VTSSREQIIDTITRVTWYADQRDWDRLPALFADTVFLDYSSITGGEPSHVAPADIVESWRQSLGRLDATQHLVTNHLVTVDGDQASVTAHFIATHVLSSAAPDPLWTLGGHYRWTLAESDGTWRVTGMTTTALWQTGNMSIMNG
jgi:hypothetical protein